jgi:SAM-dependent methyltransferase
MSKVPAELSNWYAILDQPPPPEHLIWLSPLQGTVESIANFGCWSAEPFLLLWILDATEIKVIEKEQEHLDGPIQDKKSLSKEIPDALAGRSIEFIVGDMTTGLDEAQLPSDYFDLAYCERVLCHMSDLRELENAISEMARTVKPGGRVIAVESMPDQQGNPRLGILAPLFEKAGLEEENLGNAPEDAHCYRKPRSR